MSCERRPSSRKRLGHVISDISQSLVDPAAAVLPRQHSKYEGDPWGQFLAMRILLQAPRRALHPREQSWSPVALPLPSAVFTRFPAFARYRAAFSEGPAPGLGGLGGGAALPSYLVINFKLKQ